MEQYHEPVAELGPQDRDIVRALQSLIEEVDAVNWYHQRAATTQDQQIRAILEHNRDEEIEHACMILEYLRRIQPGWDSELRTYLFTEGEITQVEAEAMGRGAEPGEEGKESVPGEGSKGTPAGAGDLGIGSMKPGRG